MQQSEKSQHFGTVLGFHQRQMRTRELDCDSFIKTLGESNQDALASKFPDDRGYVCSNLLFEVPT